MTMIYTGEYTREISFPLGGIGTGCIGLTGDGSFADWEIFNRPNKGSLNAYTFFAVRAEYPDGMSVVKVVQGDRIRDLCGQFGRRNPGAYGHGPHNGSMCGLPHFRNVTFNGRFPAAELTFEDEDFPATVKLTACNPMIPLNSEDSSLPAAFFDLQIISRADNVTYTVVFSVGNPFDCCRNEVVTGEKYTAIKILHHGVEKNDLKYGDLTVAVDVPDGICQEYWYRGGWQDKLTTFWYELEQGNLRPRHYDTPQTGAVCTVGDAVVLGADECRSFRFLLAWNMPNTCNEGNPWPDETGKNTIWKNYYATRFADSTETARYAINQWDRLYQETMQFRDILHHNTLDPVVTDAVSSTLAVLKSPTVLRLEDGTFYGWEGVNPKSGSCEGTCTHVWSYAYALCFLFPELERSIREAELNYSTNEHGEMQFRVQIPLGRPRGTFHACVDGQMATVVKIYRDWKLTGDTDWLKKYWPQVKSILEYAWSEANEDAWDRDKDGILEGRQHHTLDMELFGPSSWLESMYLAALKAAAEMAEYLGEPDKHDEYMCLYENGRRYVQEHLFNGKYFIHNVDLTRKEYIERFDCPKYWNEEQNQLKYQIGEGSSIDQMLGQWHAGLCGLGDIFDPAQRSVALKHMMQYNFRPSMRNVANVWRVFAMNDEAGTVICSYPEGCNRPVIPVPYGDECMTGFEYAFAGLLIQNGMMDEGMQVVRAIRDRYDGKKRNPWNEIECGSNYARAMASFALLPIFSGFSYDLPHKTIGFAPVMPGDFCGMWNTGTGWGQVKRTGTSYEITVAGGSLTLDALTLGGVGTVRRVTVDGCGIAFAQQGETLRLNGVVVRQALQIEV
jgi:uncharacterized protein (DUF608 family)